MTPEQRTQLAEIQLKRREAVELGRLNARTDHDGRDWPPGYEADYLKAYVETLRQLFRDWRDG